MARLAKLSSKNQLTLPKAVLKAYPNVQYFDVSAGRGGILLKPLALGDAPSATEAVQAHLKRLCLGPQDVRGAVRWARGKKTTR